jgi:hypothetical protein
VRSSAATLIIASIAVLATAVASEADMKGNRPTLGDELSCKGWDCEGKIICSCCYDDGCWICDYHAGTDGPQLYGCQWDWKAAGQNAPVTKVPGAVQPGGGVLDPGTITPLFVPRVPPTGVITQ